MDLQNFASFTRNLQGGLSSEIVLPLFLKSIPLSSVIDQKPEGPHNRFPHTKGRPEKARQITECARHESRSPSASLAEGSENFVARASRPLGRGHLARAIGGSGTLPRQRAGRPRYIPPTFNFYVARHTTG